MQQLQQLAPAFALRLALFYAAIFFVVGSYLPFFPVWLAWRDLDPVQISIVMSAPLIIRVACTPAISFLTDRAGDRRSMLILLAWGSLGAFLMLTLASTFWQIFATVVLHAVFWTTVMPLTEATAMTGVREKGLDYGRMRLWGSLTFILASVLAGRAVAVHGPQAALLVLLTASAILAVVSLVLPRGEREPGRAFTALGAIRLSDALALARSPVFLIFLFATSATQGAHALYYAFGTLHWQSLGIGSDVIGLLWSIGVVFEIALFAVSRSVVAILGPTRLILIATLASILRWGVTALDPPLAVLFAVQSLHALTFGAAHLGAVHFISEAVPERLSSTAQGLYAAVAVGLSMGLLLLASGPLYAALGAKAFFVMAGLGVAATVAAVILARQWHGQQLVSMGARSRGS